MGKPLRGRHKSIGRAILVFPPVWDDPHFFPALPAHETASNATRGGHLS